MKKHIIYTWLMPCIILINCGCNKNAPKDIGLTSGIDSGEVFLCTVSTIYSTYDMKTNKFKVESFDDKTAINANFNIITYKMKRLGSAEFDQNGMLVDKSIQQIPVFVSRKE